MKKALLAFAVVSITFASCGSNDKKTTDEVKTSDTTTVVKKDTVNVIKDTTVKTTVVPAGKDTTKK